MTSYLIRIKYNEIQTAIEVVEEFGIHSGLKLKKKVKKKTECLLLGINKHKPHYYAGLN